MLQHRGVALLSLAAALLSTGCGLPCGHHGVAPVPLAPMPVVTTVLPEVHRDDSRADPENIPPAVMPPGAADRMNQSLPYRALEATACQCLAAQNAPLSGLLDSKRAALAEEGVGHGLLGKGQERARQKGLAAQLLFLEASLARNLAAGTALEEFYRLAQAEARWHLLRLTTDEVESALSATKAQRDRGLAVSPAYEVLQRQRLELRGEAGNLAAAIEQINGDLISRLHLVPHGGWRIWPVMDWVVDVNQPPVEQMVAVGLAHRPDLALLRTLSMNLDGSTASLARAVLALSNPLLGVESPGATGLASLLRMKHFDGRRLHQQLTTMTAWRERSIAEEVRQAAIALESAAFQANIAHLKYLARKGEMGQLASRLTRGLIRSSELSEARLEVLKARGDWVDKVILWNLSRVQLKKAQGILAEECGFGAAGGAVSTGH